MSVAVKSENLSAGFPFRGSILLRRRPSEVVAAHHFALIPTKWGVCGVSWEQRESEGGKAFREKASRPLLNRIVTPGMPVHELRVYLMSRCPLCNEVFGDKNG